MAELAYLAIIQLSVLALACGALPKYQQVDELGRGAGGTGGGMMRGPGGHAEEERLYQGGAQGGVA